MFYDLTQFTNYPLKTNVWLLEVYAHIHTHTFRPVDDFLNLSISSISNGMLQFYKDIFYLQVISYSEFLKYFLNCILACSPNLWLKMKQMVL